MQILDGASSNHGKFHGDSAKTKLPGDVDPGPGQCVLSLPVAEVPPGDRDQRALLRPATVFLYREKSQRKERESSEAVLFF